MTSDWWTTDRRIHIECGDPDYIDNLIELEAASVRRMEANRKARRNHPTARIPRDLFPIPPSAVGVGAPDSWRRLTVGRCTALGIAAWIGWTIGHRS